MFQSSNKIFWWSRKSFMLLQITVLILAFGIPMVGLDAKSINSGSNQPVAAKEGDNILELRLLFKGNPAHCVDTDEHSDYCLALSPARMLSKGQGFKFYLNKRIVYNCSSSDRCTDHGVLFERTRSKKSSEECQGIPFANISEDLIGEYTVLIEDNENLLTASFNLTLCKYIELTLRRRGQRVECVNHSEMELNYCLTIENIGKHFINKPFRCFLGNSLIYNCSENFECTGHGILHKRVWPVYTEKAKTCYGIPFADVVLNATGKYSCKVEDDVLLLIADFDLHFCNGSHVDNDTKTKTRETESPVHNETKTTTKEIEENQWIIELAILILAIIAGIIFVIIYQFCVKRKKTSVLRQNERPRSNSQTKEGEDYELIDKDGSYKSRYEQTYPPKN